MFRAGQLEVDAIKRVVDSKKLFRVNDGNKEVDNFEKDFAKIIGTDYALLMSGGTMALVSALVGLGIKPGDEVIVPGYTFMASASAVVAVGAIPVLAEIDETLTLDPKDVEKKITKHTKAIIPVHICGFPANMDALCEIAKKHNLYIVEDACQADGGKYKGKRLGSIGDVGAYSFNFFKLISSGEGGAIVTNNRKAYERALIYHDGGAAFRPYSGDLSEPVFVGAQLRANELQGAFMRAQLTRMDGIIEDLHKVKKQILDAVADIDVLKTNPSNDAEGELATTLSFIFDSADKAMKFKDGVKVGKDVEIWCPYYSDKHVYINWTPILEHRGAHCDELNPFLMEANKGLQMDYSVDMLPNTLDILKRTVYISLHCDWDAAKVQEVITGIRNSAKAL